VPQYRPAALGQRGALERVRREFRPQVGGELRGEGERAAQPFHAMSLIRPDVGGQGQPTPVRRGVDRGAVPGGPLDDVDSHGRRRLSAPRAGQNHWRRRVAVAAGLARYVESVRAQVQAGAGADLDQPDRQGSLGREVTEASQQRRGPAHLVGLRRPVQPVPDRVTLVGQHLPRRRPGPAAPRPGVGGAARRGIERRELGCPPGQHQGMNTSEHPQA